MGQIGVRCSAVHYNLWFHLDVEIAYRALDPAFRTDGTDKEKCDLLGLRYPWNQLTYIGSRIIIRVLAIPGVSELGARKNYFDLEVADESLWPKILPKVVEIIRHETKDPQAKVVIKPNEVTPVPQWHEDLIRELFG